MAATGTRTPLAKEPKEDQAGVGATVGGSLPADGQDMGATTATSDTAGVEGAQEGQEGSQQERDKAQRAALLEEAGQVAAKLTGLMAKLAGTWQTPLADTEPRVMALAARLVPAAECLETVRENLVSTTAQPDSAREQMLQAEAHLGFAQLHMAAAQRFQTPASEMKVLSNAPSIPAGAQLVKALTEARGFEATASAPQASWTREALRRTACVSYVAIEACKMAAQAAWDSWQDGTYLDLLDREERKLDEAFGNMMPDELSGAVVAAAEVWLDDAYNNITALHACMAARRQQEQEQEEDWIATLGEHPEPSDGETSAEKARRLWIPRASQQTSYVSHMAREICDDSTKARWSTWSYQEYRRLLDEEMMEVCRIYAEVELAKLPVSKGKEAKGWLTSAHQDAERAREHIGERIERKKVLWALLYPATESSSLRSQQRRARGVALREAKGAGAKPRKQAKDAAARARLQATRATGTPGKSQLAGEADTKTEGKRSGRQRSPTYPRATDRAEWTWWIQPASPTLQTREEYHSFSEVPQAWAPAHQGCRACCRVDKQGRRTTRRSEVRWPRMGQKSCQQPTSGGRVRDSLTPCRRRLGQTPALRRREMATRKRRPRTSHRGRATSLPESWPAQ
jgi:hypothetical protein